MSLLDTIGPDETGRPRYIPTRSEIAAHTRELAHTAPIRMRAAIGDDAWLGEYGDILKAGCRKGDRTCINAVAALLKAGGGEDMLDRFLAMIGFASLQAGQRAAQAAAVAVDPAETEREALAWVQGRRRLAGRPLLIDPEVKDAEVMP